MKIKAYVTETRVVQKQVVVDVADDADRTAIEQAVRKAAYDDPSEHTGWTTLEVTEPDWGYEEIPKRSFELVVLYNNGTWEGDFWVDATSEVEALEGLTKRLEEAGNNDIANVMVVFASDTLYTD